MIRAFTNIIIGRIFVVCVRVCTVYMGVTKTQTDFIHNADIARVVSPIVITIVVSLFCLVDSKWNIKSLQRKMNGKMRVK